MIILKDSISSPLLRLRSYCYKLKPCKNAWSSSIKIITKGNHYQFYSSMITVLWEKVCPVFCDSTFSQIKLPLYSPKSAVNSSSPKSKVSLSKTSKTAILTYRIFTGKTSWVTLPSLSFGFSVNAATTIFVQPLSSIS